MKYLILLLITTALCANNFKRNNSLGVVVDNQSKLMWMDTLDNAQLQKTHKEAVPYCEELSFAGYSNWRIPTIEEFETIVDKSNEKTYINKNFRFNLPLGYWALKAHFRTFWFYADYMNFVSGTKYYDNRNKEKLIRCVRDMNNAK